MRSMEGSNDVLSGFVGVGLSAFRGFVGDTIAASLRFGYRLRPFSNNPASFCSDFTPRFAKEILLERSRDGPNCSVLNWTSLAPGFAKCDTLRRTAPEVRQREVPFTVYFSSGRIALPQFPARAIVNPQDTNDPSRFVQVKYYTVRLAEPQSRSLGLRLGSAGPMA